MFKKFILSFLVIGLIGAASFFAYQTFFKAKQTPWMAIPNSAVFVIELDDISILATPGFNSVQNIFLQNNGIKNLKTIIKEINSELEHKYKSNLNDYINNTSLTASFHNSGNDTLHLLASIPLSASAKGKMYSLKELFEKSSSFKFKVNSFEGNDIYEFNDIKTNKNFFIYQKDDLLLISSKRELLIDATNILENGGGNVYHQKQKHLKNEIKLEEALIYVNYPNLTQYSSSLIEDEEIAELAYLADHAFLDISVTTDQIFLHGFSESEANTPSYLAAFDNQTPGKFSISKLLLAQTAKLSYFYIDDYDKFHDRLNNYYSAHHNGEYLEHYTTADLKFNPNEFYEQIEPQIAMSWAKNELGTLDKYFYLKALDIDICKDLLTTNEDNYSNKTYDGHNIYHNPITQLPRLLLGDVFHSWSDSYFTLIDGFFVFAESEQSLMILINELNADHNWNKAIGKNITNDEAFLSHNLGVYLNPGLLLSLKDNNLTPKAQERVNELRESLSTIDLVSLQYSREKDKTYTTLLLKLKNSSSDLQIVSQEQEQTSQPTETVKKQLVSLSETSFTKTLTKKPYLVKNHIDNNFYTITQDKNNVLHYIARSGKEIWNYKLNNQLVSPVFQIDLFKNKKIQYLFATSDGIHCLDVKGRSVEKFPITFKNESLNSLNVIDYENDKNYRIAVSTNRNNIYLCNSEGKKLDGWNPKKVIGQLSENVKHFRVGSKDYLCAVEQQGIVHLYSRNGKYAKGFPIELKQEIVSNYHIATLDSKTKQIILVTKQGRILGVSQKGEVTYINQMPEGFKYQLFSDPSNKIIGFSNGESYFNSKGELVFNLSTKKGDNFQVFELKNQQVIAYNDSENGVTYLCNENGISILDNLPSKNQIGLLYSSTGKKYLLYTVKDKLLVKWKFEEQ